MRLGMIIVAGFVLTACADPLAKTPKLSDVELAAETPVLEARPAAADIEENGGFFQRLMRKRTLETVGVETTASDEPIDLLASAPAEAALTDVEANGAQEAETEAQSRPRRLWLFGRPKTTDLAGASDALATELVTEKPTENPTEELAEKPTEPRLETAVDPTELVPEAQSSEELVEPEKRRRLFGFLRPKPTAHEEIPTAQEEVQLASLSPEVSENPVSGQQLASVPVQEAARSTPARRGLFRRQSRKITGPDARVVALGARLPYGQLGRVCGAPAAQLGKQVAKYPEGQPLYRLYDSAPGNIEPHVFYLTGFPDGCARSFTAALALFGSPLMHEQLRYGLPDETQPYSATDRAYEQVKSRVCRVGRKKPCGGKIGLLESNTVFLSTYESFEGSAKWSNLLLHNGVVMASNIIGE